MNDPALNTTNGIATPSEIEPTRLHELQRFAELGRLSATLLHEISNPITAAILHLEQHHDQDSLNIKQVRRNMQILRRYVDAARQQVRQESEPINFYVRPQIIQIRRILNPIARRAGVRLNYDIPANFRLHGDPVKFQQIVSNLVVNAIDAYASDTSINVSKNVYVSIAGRHQWIVVRVSDHGQGISRNELMHLFEPFYSTKTQSGHGLGIGLTVVKQYVEKDFHGSIVVTSSKQRGTIFTARLRIVPLYNPRSRFDSL